MRRLAASLSLIAIAGCTVGPVYRPRVAAELGVPDAYSLPAGRTPEDLTRWWQRFGDPDLARLVEQARAANLDLAQAVGRLRQAREALLQSRSQLLPNVSGSGGYSRSQPIVGGGSTIILPDGTVSTVGGGGRDSFSLGLDAQYQVGLFGEVRRTVEASRAEQDAARFDYAAVLVSVTGEVARNYVLARGLQAQIANARSSLALQDDNLEIAGFRVRAGLVSSLDVEQARSQRAQTAATIPQLQQQFDAAVARLGVLTGQAPGTLRPELAAARPIPGAPAVGAGIPADVLRQRPDVRAAERTLAAATARIGVARAQLYPALAISGSIDSNAVSLTGLVDTITGSLFAGLTKAIFNGGRLRSQVRGAEAAADTALAAYKSTVLAALEDVENALAALRAAQERQRQFGIALEAARNSAILSRTLYRSGLTDFTTLNQQELALLSAQNGLTQARADQATALVSLYAALGGGWDEATLPDGRPTSATPNPANTGAR
ncbi:efflux transporter outer membrane subunit [Sphingomonas sp.]|jgi:NodT family efflux transporter outer membrane factor (OMF) lipoprotein|uniref:efflux transporter outer membrane subunit n=1 Tax=Sphingomonas sp. TaxID=28214 RepID=UPI002D7EEBE5|nr:efflux transporter outer membrane subunit [Sphingomonas sp.]HEU0043165.1 efflux transporter outer membrane subunit [Sphingomonas sp.]